MKSINLLLIGMLNLICIVIIYNLYLTEKNENLMYLTLVAVIGIVMYLISKKVFDKQKKKLINSDLKNYPLTIKLRKQYIVSFAIIVGSFVKIYELIFLAGNDSKNQKSAEAYVENVNMLEGALNMGVLTPVVEEIMFRGLLLLFLSSIGLWIIKNIKPFHQVRVKYIFNTVFVIISTMFFGYLHVMGGGDYDKILPYLFSGMVLSVCYILTKSLYVPILIHMVGNIIQVLSEHNVDLGLYALLACLMYVCFIVILWSQKNQNYITRMVEQLEIKQEQYNKANVKRMKSGILKMNHVFGYINTKMFYKSKV